MIYINGSLDVGIQYLDRFSHERSVQCAALSSGRHRNPYHPTCFGAGFLGVGRFASGGGRFSVPEHATWTRMLQRCYSGGYQSAQPTYAGCSVTDEWLDYQKFAEWLTSQPAWGMPGFELDKDLIFLGNKIYSPDACSLVPGAINCLISTRARKGSSPLGACFNKEKGKYTAFCMDGDGNNKYLGAFADAVEAFSVYKSYKERVIKMVAERFRAQIDPRVFHTLMNYEVLPA